MAKKQDKEENFLIRAAKGFGSTFLSGLASSFGPQREERTPVRPILGPQLGGAIGGAANRKVGVLDILPKEGEEESRVKRTFNSAKDFLKDIGPGSANFIGMGGRPPKEMEGLVDTPSKQFEPTTYDVDTEKFTVIDPNTGSDFTNRRGNPVFYKAIVVPDEYRPGIRKAYEKYQRMPRGILEAILAKESMFGKNLPKGGGFIGKHGAIIGMRQPAVTDLKRNGMDPNLDTLDGTVMAMADYLTLRNAAIGAISPDDLYMRGYYGRPEASIDHEIFKTYIDRYRDMYPEEEELNKVGVLNILDEKQI